MFENIINVCQIKLVNIFLYKGSLLLNCVWYLLYIQLSGQINLDWEFNETTMDIYTPCILNLKYFFYIPLIPKLAKVVNLPPYFELNIIQVSKSKIFKNITLNFCQEK